MTPWTSMDDAERGEAFRIPRKNEFRNPKFPIPNSDIPMCFLRILFVLWLWKRFEINRLKIEHQSARGTITPRLVCTSVNHAVVWIQSCEMNRDNLKTSNLVEYNGTYNRCLYSKHDDLFRPSRTSKFRFGLSKFSYIRNGEAFGPNLILHGSKRRSVVLFLPPLTGKESMIMMASYIVFHCSSLN